MNEKIKNIKKTKKPSFIRRDSFKKSKLGKRRRKKQIWRRARGRHNKIREKKNGHRKQPSIGYGNQKKIRNLVISKDRTKMLRPREIYNLKDLDKIQINDNNDNEIALMMNIGKKKKTEIAKKAINKKIKFLNFDPKKFLEDIKKELGRKKEKKKAEKKEEKIKGKEKLKEKNEEKNKVNEEKKVNKESSKIKDEIKKKPKEEEKEKQPKEKIEEKKQKEKNKVKESKIKNDAAETAEDHKKKEENE